MTEEPRAFDPTALIAALQRSNVRFVVIGGVASIVHGAPFTTSDLDICYDRGRENLEALANALRELGAELRGVEPGLPFLLDARTLGFGDSFTFRTVAGDLDCLGTPSGTGGFPDLVAKAVAVEVDGRSFDVASLEDLIRMKKAAGRAKDRLQLDVLRSLRDEIDGEPE